MKRFLIFVAVIAVALSLRFAFGMFLSYSDAPITSPDRYATLMAKSKKGADSLRFEYFPDQIPPEATDIKFHYYSGGFPGLTVVQVRYKLPQAEIDGLYRDLSARKVYSRLGNEPAPGQWRNKSFLPPLTEVSEPALSSDFEFFYLKDRWGVVSWNYGIAISPKRSEVLYYIYMK